VGERCRKPREPTIGTLSTVTLRSDVPRAALRDGVLDGTIVELPNVDQTATVLFNQVGWTYLVLRVGQRWSPEHARDAVVTLAMAAVAASPSAGAAGPRD
jgi:hypothetical protein